MKFFVDLPNPHDLEAPFINVGEFNSMEDAVKFIRQFLCCDDQGNANLITTLVESEGEDNLIELIKELCD